MNKTWEQKLSPRERRELEVIRHDRVAAEEKVRALYAKERKLSDKARKRKDAPNDAASSR